MFKVPDELENAFALLYARQPWITLVMLKQPITLEMSDEPGHTACTNGQRVKCGRVFFSTLTDDERYFVLGHELIHCIMRHSELLHSWSTIGNVTGTSLPTPSHPKGQILTCPYDDITAQHSLDLFVNDLLLFSKFSPNHMPAMTLHKPHIGGWKDRESDIYVRYYKNKQQKPDANKGGNKPGEGAGDVEPTEAPDDGGRRDMLVKEAFESLAKSRGLSPGEFAALVNRVAPTRIKWSDVVRPKIQAITGTGHRTWSRLDTYAMASYQIEPARTGKRAGVIALAMDSSGSVDMEERAHWLGSLSEICKRCRPKHLYLLEVDAKVARSTEIKSVSDMNRKLDEIQHTTGLAGNGGTSMCAVDHWLVEKGIKPDLTIILTDGGTDFPDSLGNSRDVVWVITRDVEAPARAGRTVRMHLHR